MPSTPATVEAVTDGLMPAVGALRRLLRRGAGPAFGDAVSAAQREVLLIVSRYPGRSVADVAHELGLAPNSVSTMVTQLVAAELLVRVTDPQDRRIGRLHLSPDAAVQATAARDRRRALLQTVIAGLSPGDVADLAAGIDALGVLVDQLRASDPASAHEHQGIHP
jgi:DNA-binding MarR family transcriptional regulator